MYFSTCLVILAFWCFYTESSASKAVNYGAVPVLLQMFCDWHRTDHHNRQTGVRKSIVGVLKSITMTSKNSCRTMVSKVFPQTNRHKNKPRTKEMVIPLSVSFPVIHSFIYSFIHPSIQMHSLIHTFIPAFIQSATRLSIHPFVRPFIHFFHPFIHSFVLQSKTWPIHSLVQFLN
jgi:hypothetical protein